MIKAPKELRKIQRQIRSWIHDDKVKADFEAVVVNQKPLSARGRVQVYRSAWRNRLVNCLSNDLKVCYKILGKSKFEMLVEKYIHAYPSASYSLYELPNRLPEFLKTQKVSTMIVDLCRLEMAVDKSFVAASGDSIPFEALQTMDSKSTEKLVIKTAPSVFLIKSKFSLIEIWKRQKKLSAGKPGYFLVYRSGLKVKIETLPFAQWKTLKGLSAYKQLMELLANHVNPTDLIGWLKGWAEKGIIKINL